MGRWVKQGFPKSRNRLLKERDKRDEITLACRSTHKNTLQAHTSRNLDPKKDSKKIPFVTVCGHRGEGQWHLLVQPKAGTGVEAFGRLGVRG